MIPEVVTARATWLFVKGERETVRLTVRHVDASYELSVAGPAHYRVSYQFADAMLLIRHQGTIEAQLLEQGYVLEHFMTDRRTCPDRRAYPRRVDRDRRRQ